MKAKLATLFALGATTALTAVAEEKTYDVKNFDEISVSRVIDVVYTQGNTQSVRIDVADGNFNAVEVEVKGDTLHVKRPIKGRRWGNTSVRTKNGEKIIKINGKRVPVITAYVTTPDLSKVSISSSSTFVADGIETNSLKFDASSSAEVEARGLNVSALDIGASSSADIMLDGTCGDLDAKASSSGDIVAKSLSCQTAEVKASSSGDVYFDSTGGDVTVYASSSGDVKITGTCASFYGSASSSGEIDGSDLQCADAEAKASSGGDVSFSASGYVKASASSGGDVTVYGQPENLEKSESSGGDVTVRNS